MFIYPIFFHRALRPLKSARRKQMHSLMVIQSHLKKRPLDMVAIMDITTVMSITTVMATKGIIMVFTPAVLAMVIITTMVMMAMAVTMGKVKVNKMLDNRFMSRMVVYLKGNILQI